MILGRFFGRTLYAGRDRFRRPFLALARSVLHTECGVCGPEVRVTWQDDPYFQLWRWGASVWRLTVERI